MKAAVSNTVPDFHMKKFGDYYTPGILEPSVHMNLVETMEDVAETARVPEKFIFNTRMGDFCAEKELKWVSRYYSHRKDGCAGLAYTGNSALLEDRMFSIAGAFLRNYIDARMFTIHEIIDRLRENSMGDYSVVLVPNFFMGTAKKVPDWQISLVQSWLMGRYARSRILVLYVSNMEELAAVYGTQIRDHINKRFYVVKY